MDLSVWSRRLWRKIYWFGADRRTRGEYGGASRYIYFGGTGPGDELMLTTVLHELRRRGGKRLGVLTSHPELFLHSPDVDVVHPMRHDNVAMIRRLMPVDQSSYIQKNDPPDIDHVPSRHILAEMCRTVGITGRVALRPYLFLTEAERAIGRRDTPYLVIQSSRRASTVAIGNKEWLPPRIDAVAAALTARWRVIQLGHASEPALPGVEDLRGKTTVRESAALLAGAAGFVGLVGFLMHLARAVECPAVIVFGGREHPRQSGYVANLNLYSGPACSPCWRRNTCDYEHRCMTAISVNDVLTAVDRLLAAPAGRPLPCEELLAEAEDPVIPVRSA
jgi:hypothetical protein